MADITITAAEAESLAEHLEWYILQEVRDNTDLDNINYLVNLVHVYEKCKAVSGDG